MFYRLLERILRRGMRSQKGVLGLGQMENLARSGMACWVLAQEKARLDYLDAKETYQKRPTWGAFENMMERLLQLQSTNALVQSLMNEYLLNQMLAKTLPHSALPESAEARRCA